MHIIFLKGPPNFISLETIKHGSKPSLFPTKLDIPSDLNILLKSHFSYCARNSEIQGYSRRRWDTRHYTKATCMNHGRCESSGLCLCSFLLLLNKIHKCPIRKKYSNWNWRGRSERKKNMFRAWKEGQRLHFSGRAKQEWSQRINYNFVTK